MPTDQVGARVRDTIGAPTLTLVAESGETRHLLGQAALLAAALWLAGKYLDGFLGDPVQELAKHHRQEAQGAIVGLFKRLRPSAEVVTTEELQQAESVLVSVLATCSADQSLNSAAGRAAVEAGLTEAGVPSGVARRTAEDLEKVLRSLAAGE